MRTFEQWLNEGGREEKERLPTKGMAFWAVENTSVIGGIEGPGEGNDVAPPDAYKGMSLGPNGSPPAVEGIHYRWAVHARDDVSDAAAAEKLLRGHPAYLMGSQSNYMHDFDNRSAVVVIVPEEVGAMLGVRD